MHGVSDAVDETIGVVFVAAGVAGAAGAAVAVDKERMLWVHVSLVMAVMALNHA